MNPVRNALLSYIKETKLKKKTCTGHFTAMGKTVSFIRIYAKESASDTAELKKTPQKMEQNAKSLRTSKQFISSNKIIPNNY